MTETDILKILLAAFLGGLIGFEREASKKEAGFRTNMLIALGSCLFAILSQSLARHAGGDPQRLMAQIITGIGFIGAGTIIHSRFTVHGLTTAATIWVVSAIGITVAGGFYLTAIVITLLILIILNALRTVVRKIEQDYQIYFIIIRFKNVSQNLAAIKQIMHEESIISNSIELTHKKEFYELCLNFRTSEQKCTNFINKVLNLQGIEEIVQERM